MQLFLALLFSMFMKLSLDRMLDHTKESWVDADFFVFVIILPLELNKITTTVIECCFYDVLNRLLSFSA